jgi:hypothetical protein
LAQQRRRAGARGRLEFEDSQRAAKASSIT